MKVVAIGIRDKDIEKIRKKFPEAERILIFRFSHQKSRIQEEKGERFQTLSEFILPNFESVIKEGTYQLVSQIFGREDFSSAFSLKGGCLLPLARFHFINKALRLPLRYFLTIENIISQTTEADIYLISPEFYKHIKLLIKDWRKIKVSRLWWLTEIKEKIELLLLPLAAPIYEFFFLPLIARRIPEDKVSEKSFTCLYVGYLNEFSSLVNAKHPELKFPDNEDLLFFHPSRFYRRYESYKKILPVSSRYLAVEHLFKLRRLPHLLSYYFKTIFQLITISKKEDFKREFIFRGYPFFPLIKREFLSFFFYFTAVAFKYYLCGIELINSLKVPRVFFSYAHTWYMSILNNLLRSQGLETSSYNHGLIQEALLMTSEVTRVYSLSLADLSVMKEFSADLKYVHLPPAEQCEEPILPRRQSKLRILIISKLIYVDSPYGYTIDFLDETFRGLLQLDDFLVSPLVIKFHPKEPYAKALNFLSRHYPEAKFEVFKGFIADAIEKCDLAISPMSTTITDCFCGRRPFFIYHSPHYSLDTFYRDFPRALVYRNHKELTQLLHRFWAEPGFVVDFYKEVYQKYFFNR